ncbi:MAG: T9SS type A sorting domain-containing protein [Chlorobi bacterium]|nr:T9SS type A sorting domain-containing protein [Chlorobiota bacterium]
MDGILNPIGVDLKWRPVLMPVLEVREPEGPEAEKIEQIKKEKLKLKFRKVMGPTMASRPESADRTATSAQVFTGRSFQGNTYNYWFPGDNHLAVSNGGYIVSVANGSVIYQNLSGGLLFFQSLNQFANMDADHYAFDPVVIYDPQADRFIMVILSLNRNGRYDSEIHILFSRSSNPMNGWFHYIFPGDFFSNGNWADYPKIGLAQGEFFLSLNLFNGNDRFQEALLLQLNKQEGYAGGSMSYRYWHNFSGGPFTLVPVTHGLNNDYGPPAYFLSTVSSGGSSIKVYEITDRLSGSPSVNYSWVSVPSYSIGADGPQQGTSILVDVGDCRIQSAVKTGDVIHYVFSDERSNGWNGINYHRLNLQTWSVSNPGGTWGLDQYDYAYPSIASAGTHSGDYAVVIGFLRSSATIYPEVRYVYVDHNGNYAGSRLIKSGEGYLDLPRSNNSNISRWGDYSGTVRQFNTDAVVWVTGMYGNTQNRWDGWTAEVIRTTAGIESQEEDVTSNVFPNPFRNNFSVEFELPQNMAVHIFLTDLQGKKITDLYQGEGYSGKNVFQFHTGPLARGTYFLTIRSGNQIIAHEKVLVE